MEKGTILKVKAEHDTDHYWHHTRYVVTDFTGIEGEDFVQVRELFAGVCLAGAYWLKREDLETRWEIEPNDTKK